MTPPVHDQETRIFFGDKYMRYMTALVIVLVIPLGTLTVLGFFGYKRHSQGDALLDQLDRIGFYSAVFVVLAVATFVVVARAFPVFRLRGDQLVCARAWRPLTIDRASITRSRVTPHSISIFTASGNSFTVWRPILNQSDAALIVAWLPPLLAVPGQAQVAGAAAAGGAGDRRLPLTRDLKFIIVVAAISLAGGLAVGIAYFTHAMALLNAQQPIPFATMPGARSGVGTPDDSRTAAAAAAGKSALQAEYRAATSQLQRTTALLGLAKAIKDSHAITDEDRGVLRDYMGDAQTDRDGKICAMLCIFDVRDRASIGWLIDLAMAETDDEWRRRVVGVLLIMDRKATIAAVGAKMALDERYRNVQRIIDANAAKPR